jgi:diguanylate cyclase (GGDEF)-like protein/PAS domain S-box-containing protein
VALTLLTLAIAVACATAALALLRRTARARTDERRLYPHRFAVESFPGALLLFDRRLRHMLAGGRGLAAMGLAREALEGRTPRDALPPHVHRILEPPYRAALEGHASTVELVFRDCDYLIAVTPVCDDAGRVVAGLATAQDVTERKQREYRLTELASRDSLTGAWNRRRLIEELEWLLRGNGVGSLVLLDLNGFKQVNDVLGHEAGDRLLRRVAQVVQSCVRRADVVARLGGDEFAVLLAGATPEAAQAVAAKIETAIETVWPLGIRGGASVGVAPCGGAGRTAEEVLAGADRAMYARKRAALRAAS